MNNTNEQQENSSYYKYQPLYQENEKAKPFQEEEKKTAGVGEIQTKNYFYKDIVHINNENQDDVNQNQNNQNNIRPNSIANAPSRSMKLKKYYTTGIISNPSTIRISNSNRPSMPEKKNAKNSKNKSLNHYFQHQNNERKTFLNGESNNSKSTNNLFNYSKQNPETNFDYFKNREEPLKEIGSKSFISRNKSNNYEPNKVNRQKTQEEFTVSLNKEYYNENEKQNEANNQMEINNEYMTHEKVNKSFNLFSNYIGKGKERKNYYTQSERPSNPSKTVSKIEELNYLKINGFMDTVREQKEMKGGFKKGGFEVNDPKISAYYKEIYGSENRKEKV